MFYLKVLLSALSLAGLLACSGTGLPRPVVDYKVDFDFSSLESISLLPRRNRSSLLLSDMTFDRIDRSLVGVLADKGFIIDIPPEEADLVLSWFLVEEEQTTVRGYNANAYYHCWRCGPAVSDYSVSNSTQGTFIVDLIDLRNNQSVWRSVIQHRVPSNPEVTGQQDRLNALARQMFRDFPP